MSIELSSAVSVHTSTFFGGHPVFKRTQKLNKCIQTTTILTEILKTKEGHGSK